MSQAQREDHNGHKTIICFRRNSSFIWIWCTQSSLMQISNYRDTKKQTIHNIVSRVGEVLHSIVTLIHSLSHFHGIVASPPKGHSSHKKENFSAQPHTTVKQSSKPKGNLMFPSLFSSSKNCMHDETWGSRAEIILISNLKRKKKERDFWNASLDANFLTFHCMSLCVLCYVYMY